MASATLPNAPRLDQLQNAELDEILASWHRWAQGDKGVRGFRNRALLIGDIRPYRLQYEGQLEAQDDEHEASRCRQVNHEVQEMPTMYRAAIHEDARNICLGISIWTSPRLPQDPEQRAEIVSEARTCLVRRLQSAGVM